MHVRWNYIKGNIMNQALLIIDIQNDYFENGANPLQGSFEAAKNASTLLTEFRSKNLPVIHVRHESTRPGSSFFIPDTFGAEIHELLKPESNELVITKHVPNSFVNTGLDNYLKSLKIDTLFVCGMMTHMCVDASVRAAKDLGYQIKLKANACATKGLTLDGKDIDAKHVQDSFIAALSYYYAEII